MAALETIDGGGVSKLRDIVKQLGYNKDVDVEFGTVTAPLPNIRVKLDNANFELEGDDIVVPDHIAGYKRKVKINGAEAEIEYGPLVETGDRVIVLMFNAGQDYLLFDRWGGVENGA